MSPTSSRKIVPPSVSTNFPVGFCSAGQRPALVPEEFRFDQAVRDGRAVDLTNGPAFTMRAVVDCRVTSSFPGAAGLTMAGTVAGVGPPSRCGGAGADRLAKDAHRPRDAEAGVLQSRFSRGRGGVSRGPGAARSGRAGRGEASRGSPRTGVHGLHRRFTSPWRTDDHGVVHRGRASSRASRGRLPGILMSRRTASWSVPRHGVRAGGNGGHVSRSSTSRVRRDCGFGFVVETRTRRAIGRKPSSRKKRPTRLLERGSRLGHPPFELLLGAEREGFFE